MNFLQNLYSNLQGYKTYIFAVLTALYGLIGFYVLHTLSMEQLVNYVLAAGVVFGFRSALKK